MRLGLLGGAGHFAMPLVGKLAGRVPRLFPKLSPTIPTAKPAVAPPTVHCHHICTTRNPVSSNQGGPWTPRFKPMFEKAGLSMENALNKVRVPGHRGPHPGSYHREVFDRLSGATSGLEGAAYGQAFRNELKQMGMELQIEGSRLHNILFGL